MNMEGDLKFMVLHVRYNDDDYYYYCLDINVVRLNQMNQLLSDCLCVSLRIVTFVLQEIASFPGEDSDNDVKRSGKICNNFYMEKQTDIMKVKLIYMKTNHGKVIKAKAKM